jgi:TM2 domain-containing membrane protein YozV
MNEREMNEAKYYFAVGSEQRGPVGPAELISMRLAPDTLVWREGLSAWQRLDTVPELIEQMRGSTIAQPTPPPVPNPPFANPVNYRSAPPRDSSKRIMAGLFGILMGAMGIHKFVLGYTGAGLIMLLITIFTCGWGGLVFGVIGFIEGIIYLTKSEEDFYQTYVVNRREWF